MSGLVWLLVAYLVTVVINLFPAFMPPSWSVLAFFLIKFHLPLLLVTIGGALASTTGRAGLAWITKHWGRRFLSKDRRHRMRLLGKWLDSKPSWVIPVVVFLFAIGPVPSNAIFIAAGLTEIRLAPVLIGFFVGRATSYTVLDFISSKAIDSFSSIIVDQFKSPLGIALEVLMLGSIVVFARIDWPKLLHLDVPGLQEEDDEDEKDEAGGASKPQPPATHRQGEPAR